MCMILILTTLVTNNHNTFRNQWLPVVKSASKHYDVDWKLIDAVIYVESEWNPSAKSYSGASGLMQIMPETAKFLNIDNAEDPNQSIWGGTRYLRQMYNRFGCWYLALAAYNSGPGRVERYRDIPPYKETIRYVNKVVSLYVYGDQ